MKWFKCLNEESDSIRDVVNALGYEGLGMAYGFQQVVWDSRIEYVTVQDLCRWFRIQRPKAQKILPLFDQILVEFWQKVIKKSEKVDELCQKVIKNDASNPPIAGNGDHVLYKDKDKDKDKIPPTPKGDDADFEKFWKTYPRKVGKAAAKRIWDRKRLDPLASDIVAAVKRYEVTEQWQRENGQFIPHPSTFLNQERWDDEVTPALAAKGPSREETIRQAWKDGRILTHHFAGRHHPESLKPVDPGYRGVGIDEAVSLEAPDGKAYPLREWRIDEA